LGFKKPVQDLDLRVLFVTHFTMDIPSICLWLSIDIMHYPRNTVLLSLGLGDLVSRILVEFHMYSCLPNLSEHPLFCLMLQLFCYFTRNARTNILGFMCLFCVCVSLNIISVCVCVCVGGGVCRMTCLLYEYG
jgi:hypothetical protein